MPGAKKEPFFMLFLLKKTAGNHRLTVAPAIAIDGAW